MPEINVNGETLHYERCGSGPPLLLVHSLGTGAWMWKAQIAHWKSRFDVIAFDARGHGRSTHRHDVSVQAIAGDLIASLRSLSTAPVHAVGISMGGPICAHIAEIDPCFVRSLTIADSFAKQGAAGVQRAVDIENLLGVMSMAEYGQLYANGTIHASTDKSVAAELAASIGAMDRSAYLQAARSVFTTDVAEIMSRIKMPTSIVVGAQDTRTPVTMSEEIASLIPHAKLHVIECAAHLSNLDKPQAFQSAVDVFLSAAACSER